MSNTLKRKENLIFFFQYGAYKAGWGKVTAYSTVATSALLHLCGVKLHVKGKLIKNAPDEHFLSFALTLGKGINDVANQRASKKTCAYFTSGGGSAFTESKLSSCVLLLRAPRGTWFNALIMV